MEKEYPLIAVSIMGHTIRELKKEIDLLINNKKVDVVEWRADYFKYINEIHKIIEVGILLKQLLKNKKFIFTLRTSKEGGNVDIETEEYVNILSQVARAGFADLIDIEAMWSMDEKIDLINFIQSLNIRAISSYHNFSKCPIKEKQEFIWNMLYYSGGDILKFAVMPASKAETIDFLNNANNFQVKTKKEIIAIAMGNNGVISRVKPWMSNSMLSFASLINSSAPGQVNVDKLYNEFSKYKKIV